MTDRVDLLDRLDEVLRQPPEDALPALRSAGLLPAKTTERTWSPDPDQVQPATAALLAELTPNKPYAAGKASMFTYGPQWFSSGTGSLNEVSIRTSGGFSGVIYFHFNGLGANRKCIAWLDLRVYGGSSLAIGGTGNPSTVVVTAQATGGQRTWVPFALTAGSGGTAICYLVPTLTGQGGAWYGISLYGL